MNNNILVTGSNGQLGNELRVMDKGFEILGYKCYFTDKKELDVTSKRAIEQFCIKNKITHIINCAAYTMVDKAESDKENANKVNHLAVKYMAEIAKEQNISLIHISTDYVFDGKNYKPYTEDDMTNPNSIYGQTKLDGEKKILEYNVKNSIIIRTSWVYSSFGNNFIKTILNLSKNKNELNIIFDQIGTPTYAKDLAQTILHIIPKLNNKNVEIYHYSNEGVASWYDFAKLILKIKNLDIKVNPIETKDYPTQAQRPHYSILNKTKIKNKFNIEIPYWMDSLKLCLKEINV